MLLLVTPTTTAAGWQVYCSDSSEDSALHCSYEEVVDHEEVHKEDIHDQVFCYHTLIALKDIEYAKHR